MIRVLKIEKGKPPRPMQFSDQAWEEIRKLNMGDVTWELQPDYPVTNGIIDYPKVNTNINFIPDEIPIPQNTPVDFVSKKIEKPKDETPKVRTKRPAKKRVQGTPKG